MRKLQIAVIGSAGPEEYQFRKPMTQMIGVAEIIGKELARSDCIVINGGKGGIMEAVSKGAKSLNGITVAEVSGNERFKSNQYTDIELVTGDVAFRGPSQLIGMSDAVISLGGGAGTLQEIAVAYRMQKPIILLAGFGGWSDRLSRRKYLDERRLVPFIVTNSAKSAVESCLKLLQLEVK